MLKTVTDQNDGTYIIHIEFEATELKENEILSGDTRIKGTEAQANDYAEVFAADLRRIYPEKFIIPEMPSHDMMNAPDEGGNL